MKILVVDRETNISDLYMEEFCELGHEVIVLNRGEKLLETIEKENPQALILGVRIFGFGYFDLLERVRAAFPNLPIIFNTSLRELWQEAKAKGADFYSPKSADLGRLIEIVRKIDKNSQK